MRGNIHYEAISVLILLWLKTLAKNIRLTCWIVVKYMLCSFLLNLWGENKRVFFYNVFFCSLYMFDSSSQKITEYETAFMCQTSHFSHNLSIVRAQLHIMSWWFMKLPEKLNLYFIWACGRWISRTVVIKTVFCKCRGWSDHLQVKFSIVSLMGLNVKHNYPDFTAGEIIELFAVFITHDEHKASFITEEAAEAWHKHRWAHIFRHF